MVGEVNNEVKVLQEISTQNRGVCVCDDENPAKFLAESKGESQ